MTESDFKKLCETHGFARLAPHFYARCYGDGVYQTIFTGFKEYLCPASASYSENCRKSNYISIGIRSMYSCYNEDIFVPGKNAGGYRPADFLNKRKNSVPFNGIDEEYDIMNAVGFEILDTIATQESLIEWWRAVHVTDTGKHIHDFQLVAPLILCEYIDDAETEICVSYMQHMSSLQSYLNHVKQGNILHNSAYEQSVRRQTDTEMALWKHLISRRYNELNMYLKENYLRNMSWVCKYEIPFNQHDSLPFLDHTH